MRLLAFCLIAVTACSSSSSSPSSAPAGSHSAAAAPPSAPPARAAGSATLEGSPDGQALAAVDAYAQRIEQNDGAKPLRVVVTDQRATACGTSRSGTERMLTIDFGTQSPPAQSYTLGDDDAPTVSFVVADANGATGTSALSGTVTLAEVSADLVSGTFDVLFDGRAVKGSFDATPCPK